MGSDILAPVLGVPEGIDASGAINIRPHGIRHPLIVRRPVIRAAEPSPALAMRLGIIDVFRAMLARDTVSFRGQVARMQAKVEIAHFIPPLFFTRVILIVFGFISNPPVTTLWSHQGPHDDPAGGTVPPAMDTS
ncbi:MAG TPA: hypothetical protein VFR02_03570 [bacterium]|nr:hypothetical protein [bacterium]